MSIFDEMGKVVNDFFETIFGTPKHVNCRSKMIVPMPADGKPRYWDIKNHPVFTDETPEDYQMRKWLSQVPHGGIVGNKAVLVCYNRMHPARSTLIVEDIEI